MLFVLAHEREGGFDGHDEVDGRRPSREPAFGSATSSTTAPASLNAVTASAKAQRVAFSACFQNGVRQKPILGRCRRAMVARRGSFAAQHGIQECEIVDAPRDQADGVERGCQRLHAAEIDPAIGRLECEGAAVGSGAQGGAAGLRAEREGDHEIADRRRRAARRSPRRVLWDHARVPRLYRRRIGELGRHRLSEDDGARGSDSGDAGRVASGAMAAIDGRAVLGRHVGGVDDVLDADRGHRGAGRRELSGRTHAPAGSPRPGRGMSKRERSARGPRSVPGTSGPGPRP